MDKGISQMTMVLTEGQLQPFLAPKRKTHCVYGVCLALCILSITILTYVTSHRLDYLPFSKQLFLGRRVSNRTDDDSIQIVGFENEKGERMKFASLTGQPLGGIPDGHWNENGSDPIPLKPIRRLQEDEDLESCLKTKRTSEILELKPFDFLPNYKNPCWYERLNHAELYRGNHYGRRHMFDELNKEWNRRLTMDKEPKRLHCLPYFYLAGMPKCGTTDLYSKLVSHPDIEPSPSKEPHWMGKLRYGSEFRHSVPFEHYRDYFDKPALRIEQETDNNSGYHPLITGDGSASTLWSNFAWRYLRENCGATEPKYTNAHYVRHLLPNARIIVILRDPADRLYSGYLYFVRNKNKSKDLFHYEVKRAIREMENCLANNTLRWCGYNVKTFTTSKVRLFIGLYYIYLQEWLRVFPRNQILVLRLEDYSQEPLATLKTIFQFLGLRALTTEQENEIFSFSSVANQRRVNDRTVGEMRPDTRELLNRFYLPYNQKLSILLHDPKFLWSAP